MKQCDTLLFDLDGTLLNTLADLTDSLNNILIRNGFAVRSLEEVRGFVGNGIAKLVERALPMGKQNSLYQKCLDEFLVQYDKNLNGKTTPYDGIPQVLTELSERGYKMGIVSNKVDSAVKKLSQYYFGDLFRVAAGASGTVRKKPEPDMVYNALAKLESLAKTAVYIGDSEVDIRTAANAGLPCLSVCWGFRTGTQLLEAGADWMIQTPEELLRIFSEAGNRIDR